MALRVINSQLTSLIGSGTTPDPANSGQKSKQGSLYTCTERGYTEKIYCIEILCRFSVIACTVYVFEQRSAKETNIITRFNAFKAACRKLGTDEYEHRSITLEKALGAGST